MQGEGKKKKKNIHGGEQYKLLGDVRRAWFDVPLLNYTIANMKQNTMQFYLKRKNWCIHWHKLFVVFLRTQFVAETLPHMP